MPKLSVITINYNNLPGLKKTMDSVFRQSFTDYEYLVIDGGSTDGSKELIESNAGKLSYWVSEKDNGIYNAMNKGILKAKGELVVFLNSGDFYISGNYFLYLSDKIQKSKAAVFFGRFIWDSPIAKDIAVSDHRQHWYHSDLKRSNFPHPATVYRKEAFDRAGLFDEAYKILADYEWNARALIRHQLPFRYLDLVSVCFTADGISNSEEHRKHRIEEEKRIADLYFTPGWIFKKEMQQFPFIKKLLAKLYHKKLNRVPE